MTDSQKKIAAAIAAVMQYLQERGVWLRCSSPLRPRKLRRRPGLKLWALNGRQTQMQLRNLMQLRALGRMG